MMLFCNALLLEPNFIILQPQFTLMHTLKHKNRLSVLKQITTKEFFFNPENTSIILYNFKRHVN